MNFINSQIWWLFPIVIAAMILLGIRAAGKRKQAINAWLGPAPEGKTGHIHVSGARRGWRMVFWAGAVLFLTAVAARPWWEYSVITAENRGRDILVVFDVSKSMLATDVAPSRLEHGKWLLRELLQAHKGDRFGLLPFAGRAYLSCPLTSDISALDQYLSELDTNAIPVGGTNLGEALNVALAAFSAAEGTDRAIVLFTDGEELTGDAGKALAEMQKKHIPLFIVGLGSPDTGAPIPEVDENGRPGFKRDAKGELVKTKLNEPLLQKLATETGGVYVRSTTLDSGLAVLNRRITQLTPEGRGEVSEKLPIERFMPFLAIATLLLLVYWLLSERGRNGRRQTGVAALLVLFSLNLNAETPLPAAAPVLPAAPASDAASPPPAPNARDLYNQGVELQQANDRQAAQRYEGAISLAQNQPEVQQRAWHNFGILEHTQAREALAQAMQNAQQGGLDQALKSLDGVEKILTRAEEAYVHALATPAADAADTVTAQQALLADRELVKQLRRQIEELKEQQQKAQEQTQQAQQDNQQQQQQGQEQQQQQNQQQGQEQQSQEQQGQQQQQGQEQQSQGQQGQEQQQQGQQQQGRQQSLAEQAAETARKLQEMADAMQQQSLADRAKEAAEQLEEAARKQQAGDRQAAEENFEAARKALENAGENNSQQSGEQRQGEPQQGEQQQGEQQQGEDSTGEKEATPVEPAEQSEQQIDEAQADALLEMLTREENELRENIRKQQQRRIRPVEQDW